MIFGQESHNGQVAKTLLAIASQESCTILEHISDVHT
jgi:hypothetical protein